jgi:hypothetical protein
MPDSASIGMPEDGAPVLAASVPGRLAGWSSGWPYDHQAAEVILWTISLVG